MRRSFYILMVAFLGVLFVQCGSPAFFVKGGKKADTIITVSPNSVLRGEAEPMVSVPLDSLSRELSKLDSIQSSFNREHHLTKEQAVAGIVGTDSVKQGIIRPDSIQPVDSIVPQDSLSLELAKLDSIRRSFNREHDLLDEYGNPKFTQWNDSIAAAQDSIEHTKKKSMLEDPVTYEAKDSIVFFMGTKNAFLYGSSKVNYQDIELTSEQIAMNIDSSLVHAVGVKDSLDHWTGTPIFKQGDDTYESESMDYNFDTQKGFIHNVYTTQDEGFLRGVDSKKGPDNTIYLRHGTYTTCDREHPHFYIALSRAKVRTGKDVTSGPFWLVVEDVPLPIALPFAYFPFTSTYSSGIIMPSYGDDSTKGFYLRDGGYYFAINDNIDLKLTGEIFTKGSWGLSAQTNYNYRYKHSGSFYLNYQVTKEGEENLPDYSKAENFKIQWTHRQDSKAHPNSSFSASVNFATQSYEQNNFSSRYNPSTYSQSTRTSSVSYSRSFPKLGLSISSSFNIAQNMRDSTLSVTLPNLSISLSRIYPFKRKHVVGKERWYERIAMNYTGTLSNSISTKEDQLLKSSLLKDWNNGMKHSIPISASFTLLNYINITPSLNYNSRWYTHKIEQSWDQDKQRAVADTIYGFNRVWDYNLSVSANTKLFVFSQPNKKIFGDKIQMIRHVITPTISFSYAPDFSASRYGYYGTYTKTDLDGNVSLVEYSLYNGSLYGTPSKGKTGSISFDIGNNIEAKIKASNDSIKKVSIIDELGASLSYNMAAQRQPWSNLSTRLRLKWGKFALNLNAVFNTYAYEFDKNGNVVVGDRTEWSYGRFGRFQGMSKNLSFTFNNSFLKTLKEKWNKLLGKETRDKDSDKADEDEDDTEMENQEEASNLRDSNADSESATLDADGYMRLNMPWSFSISYGISMAEDRTADINVSTMRYPYKFTHNLNCSGSLRLSSNWNVSFSSGWDFTMSKLAMTSVNINRDMHCFNITAGMVFGTFTSYNITLRANASTLTDALKYDKRSSYSNTIQWY